MVVKKKNGEMGRARSIAWFSMQGSEKALLDLVGVFDRFSQVFTGSYRLFSVLFSPSVLPSFTDYMDPLRGRETAWNSSTFSVEGERLKSQTQMLSPLTPLSKKW